MDRFNVCHTWFDGRGSLIGLTVFIALMMVVCAAVGLGSLIGAVKLAVEGVQARGWAELALSAACLLLGLACLSFVIMMWESAVCYFGAW